MMSNLISMFQSWVMAFVHHCPEKIIQRSYLSSPRRRGSRPANKISNYFSWIPAFRLRPGGYDGQVAGMTVLFVFASFSPAQAHEKSDDAYIKKSVTREILANLFGGENATAKGTKKHSVARNHDYKYRGRGYERTGGDIYLLPNLPHYSLFFEDNDLLHANLGFDTASNSYASRGGSQDLSKLIFGQQPILIKEILLTSKLASDGKLKGNNPLDTTARIKEHHFLSILADQEVVFDASLDQYVASVDYARHFRKGDLTIGFHIPIKLRQQRLRLTNDVTSAKQADLKAKETLATPDLRATPEFHFYKHFSNLEAFVTEVLSRKGIALNKKESVVGMSDVMTYVNLDIPSNNFDRFVVGASLTLPTARERDTGKLWSSDLGNGGFTQLAAFASFLWQRSRWLNPYFHIKGTYGFGANVWRRVPRVNKYDGKNFNELPVGSATSVSSLMIFGETFIFDGTFSEQDSTVRNFADGTQKVKINPGMECLIRVGNTFDAIFSDKGFVDIYYDLFFKSKDYISRHRVDDVYQPGLLTNNTAAVRHIAGLTYAYQFDEQYRTRLGINYAWAGRNAPQALGAEVSLNFEF